MSVRSERRAGLLRERRQQRNQRLQPSYGQHVFDDMQWLGPNGLQRRQQRHRLHRTLIAKRQGAVLAIASLALVGFMSGCGSDSSDQQSSRVSTTNTRVLDRQARKLHRLSRRLSALRKEVAARHAARERQTAAEPTPDDLGTLDSLGTRLGAEIGATIGPPGMVGPSAEGGTLTSGPAWSTIKVPISLRVLEDAGGPSKLSPHQRELITRAITLSDNEAAAELFAGLERTHGGLTGASQAVAEMLRAAGDNTTQVSTVGRGRSLPTVRRSGPFRSSIASWRRSPEAASDLRSLVGT